MTELSRNVTLLMTSLVCKYYTWEEKYISHHLWLRACDKNVGTYKHKVFRQTEQLACHSGLSGIILFRRTPDKQEWQKV